MNKTNFLALALFITIALLSFSTFASEKEFKQITEKNVHSSGDTIFPAPAPTVINNDNNCFHELRISVLGFNFIKGSYNPDCKPIVLNNKKNPIPINK